MFGAIIIIIITELFLRIFILIIYYKYIYLMQTNAAANHKSIPSLEALSIYNGSFYNIVPIACFYVFK